MTVIGALSSSAGASTTSWNAKASAGALDVTLLGQKLELAGGVTEADANSTALAEAIGTGLCISSGTPGPCPTNLTSATGQSLDTTQKAIQQGDGTTAKGPVCVGTVPAAPLATIGVGCGNASATEASGNPTAEGDGSILDASALNITMGNALNAMGISLPTGSPCAGTSAPAASSSPGSGSSSLPAPAASLLDTANTIISTLKLPTLNPTTVSQNSPQDSTCSILGGLANQVSIVPVLGPLVGGLVTGNSNALNTAMGTSLLDVTAVEAKSTVTTSTNSSGDTVETAYSRGDTLGVNILGGMLDIKVVPAVATATVDRTTGKASSSCTPGLVQVTVNNGTPNIVSLQPLGDALNQILDQLEASALKPLLDALLQVPDPGILSCDAPVNSAAGDSSSVTGGIFNATLIPAAGMPGGLLTLKVNDVTASASSTSATPTSPATSPSQTPSATPAANPVPAAPAAVPNVTSVHTGEFWAGTLPIILMIGMALAGSLLIGRRKVMALARNFPLINRRGGGH